MSSLTPADKTALKTAVGANKAIVAACVAKLYAAANGGWSFTNLMGAVLLCIDRATHVVTMQMYDLNSFAPVFAQELYHNFVYEAPRPFFHHFEGDSATYGLAFCDEADAATFHMKVARNIPSAAAAAVAPARASQPARAAQPAAPAASNKAPKKSGKSGARLEISGPVAGSFVHVSHVGFNADTGFDMQNVSPAWRELFGRAGLSASDLKNKKKQQAILELMAQNPDLPPTSAEAAPRQPSPPVAPARAARKSPPPPPPPRTAGRTSPPSPPSPPQSVVAPNGAAATRPPPPPPPPVARAPTDAPAPVRAPVPARAPVLVDIEKHSGGLKPADARVLKERPVDSSMNAVLQKALENINRQVADDSDNEDDGEMWADDD